jgi:hypothetical protein
MRTVAVGRLRLHLLDVGGDGKIPVGHNYAARAGFRPDDVTRIPSDTPAERARIFALALSRDALVVCPHAPSPGLGRLRAHGSAVRWERA